MDGMKTAEEAVREYVKLKCSEISDEVKITVDREIEKEGKTVSDKIRSEKYFKAYNDRIRDMFGTNIKAQMRNMNSVMPELERGSIYVNTDITPELTLNCDTNEYVTGGIITGICLDYMYKGEIISSESLSCEIEEISEMLIKYEQTINE